jgi:hypothetical protein
MTGRVDPGDLSHLLSVDAVVDHLGRVVELNEGKDSQHVNFQ